MAVLVSWLLALALLRALAAPAPPGISRVSAPAGTESLGVEWVKVAAPGRQVLLAAVAHPPGKGPFPAVLLLHGSHGFAPEYVRLAQELSRGGVIAVAPCWFAGGGGAGAAAVSPPIACPEAPPMPDATSPEAMRTVDALVEAVRGLPGVRPDRVALFGHSRGGGATLHYVATTGRVQAAILDSSGYPDPLADLASRIRVPMLILHGLADAPPTGGGAFTSVQRAQDFEKTLRASGRTVEARYYEGGEHNGIFTDPRQHADEVQRMVAFLNRHLR
jgi:dienelactone hydrolase